MALKLKATTSAAEADALIEAIRRLPDKVPGIVELQCGRNFSPARAQGYDIGVHVRFPGRAELAAYGPHPDHTPISARIGEICESVLVIDFEF